MQDTRSISPPTRPSSTSLTLPCTTLPLPVAWPSHTERAELEPLGLALALSQLVLAELDNVVVGPLVVSLTMVPTCL